MAPSRVRSHTTIYKKLLPPSIRKFTSFLYHHYKYPGHFFNTGTFTNARAYHNFCKLFQPHTYLTRARYARTLDQSNSPEIQIDRKAGYTVVTPQMLPLLSHVAEQARDVFSRMHLDQLKQQATKKPFLIQVPLTEYEKDLSNSPFLEIATHPALLGAIARYLGMLPVLRCIEFHYSPNEVMESKKSQNFHIDQDDYREIKAFLYVEEVTMDSGPLCVIPALESRKIYDQLCKDGKTTRRNRKFDDETFYKYASPNQLKTFTVSAGTMVLADTASCWHYGSRPGSKPRYAVLFGYVTPFSSKLPWRWRSSESLPFSRMGDTGSSSMSEYVFGRK